MSIGTLPKAKEPYNPWRISAAPPGTKEAYCTEQGNRAGRAALVPFGKELGLGPTFKRDSDMVKWSAHIAADRAVEKAAASDTLLRTLRTRTGVPMKAT